MNASTSPERAVEILRELGLPFMRVDLSGRVLDRSKAAPLALSSADTDEWGQAHRRVLTGRAPDGPIRGVRLDGIVWLVRTEAQTSEGRIAAFVHDLKNPLSSVSAALSVLASAAKGPEAEILGQMQDRLRLLCDGLDEVQVVLRPVVPQPELVDLAPLVRKAVAGALREHPQLEIHADVPAGCRAVEDPRLLVHALRLALVWAAGAEGTGPVHLEIHEAPLRAEVHGLAGARSRRFGGMDLPAVLRRLVPDLTESEGDEVRRLTLPLSVP
jgi:signal transduction histidine kinase